jgi:SP family sugar porter-like MFS transporter
MTLKVKNKVNIGYLSLLVLVPALGGLMFGYDWVVIGGAKPFYELYFHISEFSQLQGWAMSSALLGCIFGALIAGSLSERIGRKKPLLISGGLFALSLFGTGISGSFIIFISFRIMVGLAIGMATILSPVFIAEVSPNKWRGWLVSINQLNIVIGILLAQIINYLIAEKVPDSLTHLQILHSWNGQMGWRWMFWAGIPFALLFFILAFFIPESPRWLIKMKRNREAVKILSKIGGKDYAEHEAMQIEQALDAQPEKFNYKKGFSRRKLDILLLGIFIAGASQLCGINLIFNYADEIFRTAGFGLNNMLFNIVITGGINLIFTFVALGTIDSFGRRKLMLLGFGGLSALYILLGILYYFHSPGISILIVILFCIAIFAMTIGPGTWVLLSEIFPNEMRTFSMSIATFMLWVSSFLITFFFPIINNAFGTAAVFWIFAGICIISFMVLFIRLPETMGKSLEEIEKNLY